MPLQLPLLFELELCALREPPRLLLTTSDGLALGLRFVEGAPQIEAHAPLQPEGTVQLFDLLKRGFDFELRLALGLTAGRRERREHRFQLTNALLELFELEVGGAGPFNLVEVFGEPRFQLGGPGDGSRSRLRLATQLGFNLHDLRTRCERVFAMAGELTEQLLGPGRRREAALPRIRQLPLQDGEPAASLLRLQAPCLGEGLESRHVGAQALGFFDEPQALSLGFRLGPPEALDLGLLGQGPGFRSCLMGGFDGFEFFPCPADRALAFVPKPPEIAVERDHPEVQLPDAGPLLLAFGFAPQELIASPLVLLLPPAKLGFQDGADIDVVAEGVAGVSEVEAELLRLDLLGGQGLTDERGFRAEGAELGGPPLDLEGHGFVFGEQVRGVRQVATCHLFLRGKPGEALLNLAAESFNFTL